MARIDVALLILCMLSACAVHAHADVIFGAVQYSPVGSDRTIDPNIEVSVNAANYLSFVDEAAAQGVQVLAFPEGTLGWIFANSRQSLAAFCTQIPDPLASSQPVPHVDILSSFGVNHSILFCEKTMHS